MLAVANPKRFYSVLTGVGFVLALAAVGNLSQAERPAVAKMGHELQAGHTVDARFAGLIVGKQPSSRGCNLKVRTHDGFTISAFIGPDVYLEKPLLVGHRVELIGTTIGPGRVAVTRRDAVVPVPTLGEQIIVGPVRVTAGVAYVYQRGDLLTMRTRLEDGVYERMELAVDEDSHAWLEPV